MDAGAARMREMAMTPPRRRLVLLLLTLLSSVLVESSASSDHDKRITLVGLGGMGKAILQCYAKHGYQVHAWNRGEENRKQVAELNLEGVIVHDTVEAAVEATDTTMLVINSEPNLKTVSDLVESIPQSTWENKTIINFVNHEPFAAKYVDELFEHFSIKHLAGSIFGVPQTICTPQGVVLVSAPERNTDTLEALTPSLELLGRLETFPGDVGYGALIVVGLIQSLYFGMTGFELSLLVLEKYRAPRDMIDRFVGLAKDIATSYFPMFFGVVSKSIQEREWTKTYVPAADLLALLEMHQSFFNRMGINELIYNNLYTKYLQQTVAKDANAGVSAAVKQYSTDDFVFKERKDTDDGSKEEL